MFGGQSQTHRQSSIRKIALQIRNERGLQGFWSGYSASLVLTLNPSLTFLFFDTLKRLLVPRNRRSDPPAQATFLIAAVSKAVASTITYPFSLAKSRTQASSKSFSERKVDEIGMANKTGEKLESISGKTKAERPNNVFTTILGVARAEGLSALYEGLGGEILKGFFSHGLTMIVKQIVHRFVIQLYYATLKLLKRFPSPEAALQSSREQTKQALDTIQKDAAPLVSSTAKTLQDLSSTLRDSSQDTLKKVQLEAGSASTAVIREAGTVAEKTSKFLERTKDQNSTNKRGGDG